MGAAHLRRRAGWACQLPGGHVWPGYARDQRDHRRHHHLRPARFDRRSREDPRPGWSVSRPRSKFSAGCRRDALRHGRCRGPPRGWSVRRGRPPRDGSCPRLRYDLATSQSGAGRGRHGPALRRRASVLLPDRTGRRHPPLADPGGRQARQGDADHPTEVAGLLSLWPIRGGSSVGRAPGLQPGGRGFESHPLHSRSDSMSPADWLRFLTELADHADELALRWFRSAGLRVQEKPDLSPVTEADQAIEAMARAAVRQNHPELGVLGEEEGEAPGPTEARLIIDPIDGTRNFVRGIPVFATLLAIEAGGEVVAGVASAPALGARWHAARGSGAFRDGQRMTVSRIASLQRAMLFHGNLGPGGGGAPPGNAGRSARVQRYRR